MQKKQKAPNRGKKNLAVAKKLFAPCGTGAVQE
jgi:hypothetical protein